MSKVTLGAGLQDGRVYFDVEHKYPTHFELISDLGGRQLNTVRLLLTKDVLRFTDIPQTVLYINPHLALFESLGKNAFFTLISKILKNTEKEIMEKDLPMPQMIHFDFSTLYFNAEFNRKFSVYTEYDKFLPQLRAKLDKLESELKLVEAEFNPMQYYYAYGWFDDENNVIFPEYKEDGKMELHFEMLHAHGIRDEIDAKNRGWIRWVHERGKNTLYVNCSGNTPKGRIIKVLSTLEDLLIRGELTHQFNVSQIPYPKEIVLELEFKGRVTRLSGNDYDDLIRKVRVIHESYIVNEQARFNPTKYYYSWGWINSENEILLPERKSDGTLQIHIDMIKKHDIPYEIDAIYQNWIKWTHEKKKNVFFIGCVNSLPKSNVIKAIQKLESMLVNETLGKWFNVQIPYPTQVVLEINDPQGDIRYLSADSFDELILRFRTLQEAYDMEEQYYYAHGWVDPDGKIILPKIVNGYYQYHSQMIRDYGFGGEDEDDWYADEMDALGAGWIKWSFARGNPPNMYIIVGNTTKDKLIAAIRKVIDALTSGKLNKYFDDSIPYPQNFLVEFFGKKYDSISKPTLDSILNIIRNTELLSEMIVKTDKGWILYSKDGSRKLGGPYKTKKEAKKRERQVQFFKNRGKK